MPDLSRRSFCRAMLAGTAGLSLAARATSQSPGRPNVLLITTDDMGPQLGCYGDPFARTPVLDKLASEGTLFERAYVTQASCSPSRSSIFTGLYPHQNGQIGLAHRHYSMHEGMVTLPALLKEAGYRTGVIGKVHVAPNDALPFDWRAPLNVHQTREVAKVAESANEFLTAGDGPSFLMVNYMDPHRPLIDQIEGIPEKPLTPDEVEPFPFLGIDTPKVRQEVAAYHNCNTRADVGVGMLLEKLEAAGLAENTLVIFIGDHGPPFTRGKTSCYESGVHIPFIVRWPGRIREGERFDALTSTVDILPTVCEAAGIEKPEGLAGHSILPHASTFTTYLQRVRETLATEYCSHHEGGFFPRRAIRDRRYKLIHNLLPERGNPIKNVDGCAAFKESQAPQFDGTHARRAMETHANPPEFELYDLQADPVEFHNLADSPKHQGALRRMQGELMAWRKETDDPLLDEEKLAALVRWHDEKEWETK